MDGNTIASTSGKLIVAGVAGQEIVINEASADVDLRVESDNDANALFVQGSSGNVGLGTASPTTDATLHISATDSMIIPVGTTGQRPGSPATGMYRFNTTTGTQEIYTGSEWNAGADFTVMTADAFSGDDSKTYIYTKFSRNYFYNIGSNQWCGTNSYYCLRCKWNNFDIYRRLLLQVMPLMLEY